ncbi:hypothetical protein C487_16065 [Natrinema pallidum DSM 3751]|uniref:Uncharacterized protein n=1 Tax=Natrinema pallidum DSM 3751 TaxID=1227495 RepID=L9YJA5_9EURY|nr:hypothetical protein C487_16065 [Natrinema pallidum DSM 3751]
MTVLPTGSAAVSSDIVVFVILRGRGLVSPRPSLTRRCMWILVFAKTCFEFFDSFVLLLEFLLQLVDSLFHLEKP